MLSAPVTEWRRNPVDPSEQQLRGRGHSAGDAHLGGACGRETRRGSSGPRRQWRIETGDVCTRVAPGPVGVSTVRVGSAEAQAEQARLVEPPGVKPAMPSPHGRLDPSQ